MMENLDYETLNTVIKAVSEFYKYNATLETAQKTLYAACFTAVASIVVAFITIWGNYKINIKAKNVDYKNDYYKKIIDKRMTAYEELERFLSDIDVETDMTFYGIANNFRGDSYHCYMFSCVRSQIKRYLNQSVKICGYNSWYSKKLEGLVNRLNVDFAKYFDQTTRGIEFTNGIIVGSRQDDLDNFDIMLPNGLIVTKGQFHLPQNIVINEEDIKYYVKAHDVLIGVQWFNEFKETFAEIRAVMIEDRLRLHEVEKFLTDKKAS